MGEGRHRIVVIDATPPDRLRRTLVEHRIHTLEPKDEAELAEMVRVAPEFRAVVHWSKTPSAAMLNALRGIAAAALGELMVFVVPGINPGSTEPWVQYAVQASDTYEVLVRVLEQML